MKKMKISPPAFPTYLAENMAHGMTLRQYAAIHLKVADSGLEWLDEMIEKSKENNTIDK